MGRGRASQRTNRSAISVLEIWSRFAAELGKPMVGDFSLKPFAALDRLLARRVDGRLDLCPEPGQPLLEAKQRQPVAIGMILAAELPEQFVGPLEVLVGRHGSPPCGPGRQWHPWQHAPGIVRSTVGSACCCGTAPSGQRRLRASVLPVPEDNLADDGEGKGVGIRPRSR